MQSSIIYLLLASSLSLYCLTSHSNEHFDTEEFIAKPTLFFSSYADYEKQSINNSHASFLNLGLLAGIQHDAWSFLIDIPWQQLSENSINTQQTTLTDNCQQLLSLTPSQQIQLFSRRPQLQQRFIQCQQLIVDNPSPKQQSGFGDISTFINFQQSLDADYRWQVFYTLGLKWDNADETSGLGSGSRDLITEIQLKYQTGPWGISSLFGYNQIIAGHYKGVLEDYSYLNNRMSYRINSVLELGLNAGYQQSSDPYFEDIQSIGYYGLIDISADLSWQLTLTDYLNTEGYPDYSLSSGLYYYF